MSGIIAHIPNGGARFVPISADMLSCCLLAEVASRLRRILSEALDFGRKEEEAEEEESSSVESESEGDECEVREKEDDFRVLFRERDLDDEKSADAFLKAFSTGRPCVVRVLFRLLGGKGGFGATLRKQAGRGKKTTNMDASRDLSGRRLRHSKAVERIKEWMENNKRQDELVNLLTGEGPELPKPVPEYESLDPEYMRKLKRSAADKPGLVAAGLRKLEAEEGEEVAEAAKRLRVGPSVGSGASSSSGVASATAGSGAAAAAAEPEAGEWLSALDALGSLSPDSGEESGGADAEGESSSAAAAATAPTTAAAPAPAAAAASSATAAVAVGSSKDTAAAFRGVASLTALLPPRESSEAAAAASDDNAAGRRGRDTEAKAGAGGTNGGGGSEAVVRPEDLTLYTSAEDLLKKVSAEALKQSLQRLGLKCGGKPEERAKRLFLLKDTPLKELPKSAFAAPPK